MLGRRPGVRRKRRHPPAPPSLSAAGAGRHPRLLGPAAAAGAARPVARHADPLHHRDRLSAVQLFRPRRQSGRLQRRSRADDLRGAEDRLHGPDAAVRYAAAVARRQSRRRGDRLDRGHAGDAQARRFQRSVLPHARRASWRAATPRINDVRPEQLEGKKVAVVAGTAHEAFLKALFTEAEVRPYPTRRSWRARRCARARSICCSATASRWRSGSTAPTRRIAAPFAAGRSSRAAISARASASRSSAATTRCGRRSTGRCSGCGKRAASPICGCAISRSARFDRTPTRD